MKYKNVKPSSSNSQRGEASGSNNTGGPRRPDRDPDDHRSAIPRRRHYTDEEKKEARKEAQRKYRLKNKLQAEAYNAERRPERVITEESKEVKRQYNASEKAKKQRENYRIKKAQAKKVHKEKEIAE